MKVNKLKFKSINLVIKRSYFKNLNGITRKRTEGNQQCTKTNQ